MFALVLGLVRTIALILASVFIANNSTAQTNQANKRDSLYQELQKKGTDSGRVLLLAELAYLLHESKPDTAMVLALEALSISRHISFEKGEAVSLNRIGNVFSAVGNYPKAMQVYLQALRLNEKLNNLDGKQRNLGNIGFQYRQQGEYREALKYQLQATKLAEQIDNKESICISLGNTAQIYYELKMLDSALFYAQRAYHIADGINYSRIIGASLVRLGQIQSETGQDALALEYFRRSIPILKVAENDLNLCGAFLGMAKVFEANKQNDSVLFYARKSISLAKKRRFIREIRDASGFLSMHYRNIRIPDSAFFYQDVTLIASDSLFNQQKNNQIQTLVFDEKIRQQEKALADLKAAEERKRNLQYAAIAVGVITFLILLFALSHSVLVSEKWVRFFGVLALIFVFELINLFIGPYLELATNDSPFLMLMALVCIAGLLIPAHQRLEHWINDRLVDKNKNVRLAAARKVSDQLRGDNK